VESGMWMGLEMDGTVKTCEDQSMAQTNI